MGKRYIAPLAAPLFPGVDLDTFEKPSLNVGAKKPRFRRFFKGDKEAMRRQRVCKSANIEHREPPPPITGIRAALPRFRWLRTESAGSEASFAKVNLPD